MKKNKLPIAYIIIIIILLLTLIICVVKWINNKKTEEDLSIPGISAEPLKQVVYKEVEKMVEVEKTITADIIQDGLNDMGILETEQYYFTEVIQFSDVKKLFSSIELKFTESSYLISYDGTVTAGINFEDVTVRKDDVHKTVTVTVPKAEIQNVTIDNDSFTLYSQKNGLGNPISVADYNQSVITLKETAKEKAIDRGVLERADEHAATVIKNFVSGLMGEEYTVVVNTK